MVDQISKKIYSQFLGKKKIPANFWSVTSTEISVQVKHAVHASQLDHENYKSYMKCFTFPARPHGSQPAWPWRSVTFPAGCGLKMISLHITSQNKQEAAPLFVACISVCRWARSKSNLGSPNTLCQCAALRRTVSSWHALGKLPFITGNYRTCAIFIYLLHLGSLSCPGLQCVVSDGKGM